MLPIPLCSLLFRSLTSLGLTSAALLRRFWTFPESTIPEAVDSTLPYPRLWHLSSLTCVFIHTLVHSAQPWCIPHNPAQKYVSLLLIPCTHSHDPLVAEYWDKPFSEILVLFANPLTSSESLGFSPTFYPEIRAQLLQLAFDTPLFLSTSVSAILHVPAWLTPMTEKLPEGTLGSPLQGVTTSLETPSRKPHLLFSASLDKRFVIHPHSFRLPSVSASALVPWLSTSVCQPASSAPTTSVQTPIHLGVTSLGKNPFTLGHS